MPRSARTSRQRAIASRTLARASSRVSPWLTQPGIDGHSAIQTPSSSVYTVTESSKAATPFNCAPLTICYPRPIVMGTLPSHAAPPPPGRYT